LALKGTFENVTGTEYADRIRGNSAANRLEGRGGGDRIYGGPGNDTIFGGDGDDWLYGDAGSDSLYGEAGNNALLGGPGNDLLDTSVAVSAGSEGRNLLIGGAGADTLQGGWGEEILIGGATAYDGKVAALEAVMREWASNKSFDDRCNRLDSGFRDPLDPRAGFIQLKRKTAKASKGTVLNDGLRDSLFGGDGSDWFLDFADDQTDRSAADR
jgi:Ca2+-binding RTX toxin-like protein